MTTSGAFHKPWGDRPFKHLTQSRGDGRDAGFAACMLDRCPIEDFEIFAKFGAPWNDEVVIGFLENRGWHCGFRAFRFNHPVQLLPVDGMPFEYRLKSELALLVVESRDFANRQRIVFWDGEFVHDCHPDANPEGEPVQDYAVRSVIPVIWGGNVLALPSVGLNDIEYQAPALGSWIPPVVEGIPNDTEFSGL
jgi:hypothetical protein